MKTGKTLITAVLAVSMIVASGTATAAGPVSSSPAPTAFVVPTQPGGSGGGSSGTGSSGTGSSGTGSSGTGGGINSGSTGSSTSGTGTTNSSGTSSSVTANSSTINSGTTSSGATISGNYAQTYTGRGDTGCQFKPGDLGCRGELMSGGQVVCSPC